MRYEITKDQEALVSMLDNLVGSSSIARESPTDGPAYDPELWQHLVELGFVGLMLPEARGGAGGGLIDVTLMAERIGSRAASVPVVTSAVATLVLRECGGTHAHSAVAELVAGRRIVLAAISAATGLDISMRATLVDDSWMLRGLALDLLEASTADYLILKAASADGYAWFLLDLREQGVEHGDQPSLDPTQRVGRLRLTNARSKHLGPVLDDRSHMAAAWILLAAQALGASARALTLSVDYAKSRIAFGQPIGQFQAVKHSLVEMLLEVENARSAVYNAAWSFDAGRDDALLAAHMAKAVATENAVDIVQRAIQVHGAIGFTWEHELNALLRRVKTCELALGCPVEHFESIAKAIVDANAPGFSAIKGAADK